MQARLLTVAVVVVLLAAGCGGGGGSTSDAAGLVPPDALAYLTIDTNLASAQLKSAQSILGKFPIKPQVLAAIRSAVGSAGTDVDALKSSIGAELDVALVRANGKVIPVGLTQPRDEKAFDAQLEKGPSPTVHAKVSGWTVFADDKAALDAVRHRSGKLTDDAGYQAAVATIPAAGHAIARAYVAPAGMQATLGAAAGRLGSAGSAFGSIAQAKWVAAAVTSADGAVKLEVHSKVTGKAPAASTASALAGQIPARSIVAAVLDGGGAAVPGNVRGQAATLSKQLGFDVTPLLGALDGPVIAYVRAGLPLPEVTIAAKPSHPDRVVPAVGRLIAKLTQQHVAPVPTKLDGGTLNKLDLGSLAIYYGAWNGEVVVTDSVNALAELKGSVGHLSDDAVFKEAKDGAALPDTNQGFLFLNLKDAVPALNGFAQLANQKLPPSVLSNLKPLRSLLVYGSRDGDVQTLVAYLKTS